MKTFDLRSQLSYNFQKQTPAIFNIQPVENNVQKIVGEDLYIKPSLSPEEYRGLFEQNRYLRVIPPEGDFEIAYSATVEVSYFWGDPNAQEDANTAKGYTVDKEGKLNNYAIEPEMYVNEPGDLREK